MRANYVNLSSPEQTNQDTNYVDESPTRIQSILIYILENGKQFVDIYTLGFSDGNGRLRCFDAYNHSFKARRQERWMCILIGVKNEAK